MKHYKKTEMNRTRIKRSQRKVRARESEGEREGGNNNVNRQPYLSSQIENIKSGKRAFYMLPGYDLGQVPQPSADKVIFAPASLQSIASVNLVQEATNIPQTALVSFI